jgi:hypothetical protein
LKIQTQQFVQLQVVLLKVPIVHLYTQEIKLLLLEINGNCQ